MKDRRWFLEIVRDFDGTYYANMQIEGKCVEGLPAYVDYNTLKNAIKEKTGVVILKRKDLIFKKLGRKHYAYIDATQESTDCRVTFKDFKNGYKPCFN